MTSNNSKASLRELRMTSAMSSLASSRTKAILTPSSSSMNTRFKKDVKPDSVNDKTSSNKTSVSATSKRNFNAAPTSKLNLSNLSANENPVKRRDWLSKADEILKNSSGKNNSGNKIAGESRRRRKKRLWLERKETRKISDDGNKRIRENDQSIVYVGDWAYLPDLVLEMIFQYLDFKMKLHIHEVCENWARIAPCKSVWSDFTVTDTTMTRMRYNYAGNYYEYVLDHTKASEALHDLAKKIKWLAFLPQQSLHNICDFQNMFTKYCHHYGNLTNIKTYHYVFPCNFADKNNEVDLYGTGGTVLQNQKQLLEKLTGLRSVELMDLQLDRIDAAHVLDEVIEACGKRLTTLKLVNATRSPFEMLSIVGFVNLKVLMISPHNLGDDLVECMGDMKKLRNIQIITNTFTECVAPPVDYRIWKKCRKANPKLRVHLITEGKHKNEMTFQQRAPVKSIVYDSPYIPASTLAINIAVDLYNTDLECYAHQQLPRFKMPKNFYDRADSAYLYLIRQCPYIHTLCIRERISSSTVLLLAYTGKNLRYLNVRRNAIVLKCEWPKSPDWSWDFFKWLRKNSRTYEDMEREVSQIFGFRWYALNDKQYKRTPLNLNIPFYYEGFDEADQ